MPTEAELLAARQAGYLTPAGQNLIRDGDDAISQNAVTAHKAIADGVKAARWLKSGIPLGADLNALKAEGAYGVNTYTIAESLQHRPTLVAAVDRASVEVLPNGAGGGVQRWTTTKGATAPDSPRLQRRWDSTGAWTDWERSDRDPTANVPAARASTAAHQADDGMVSLVAGLTGDPDAPWLWRAGAGVKLTTPTHDGSGQATHPSVLYFPTGRFGWKYWMAMTPYPGAQEAHEDPNVLVSNDGTTWQAPSGLTNPLEDLPGKPGAHNSDTHLVELPDGRLMVSWRTVDRPNGNRNIIKRRVSSDGVTWTPTAELITAPATGPHSTFVSQSIVRVGDRWRIYGITTGGTNQLCYIETTMDVPTYVPWSAPTVCTVRGVAADREMWHSDVQYVGGQWWAIINDGLAGTSARDGDLHLARSADGITWDYSPTPLVPRLGTDHDTLYKAGFVVGAGDALDVFYSAYTRDDQRWHVYRTTARKAATTPAQLADHGHEITDVDGLTAELDGIASALNDTAPADHGHPIDKITGLQSALNSKAGTGHHHDRRYPRLSLPDVPSSASNILELPDDDYVERFGSNVSAARGFPPGVTTAGWLQIRSTPTGTFRWAIYRPYINPGEVWTNTYYSTGWRGWQKGADPTVLSALADRLAALEQDTGLRLLPLRGDTGGAVLIRRRKGDEVTLTLRNVKLEPGIYATVIADIPLGFRPPQDVPMLASDFGWQAPASIYVARSEGNLYWVRTILDSPNRPTATQSCEITYRTANPWPTTLPPPA